jgi:transcriptional regulator with XRE-family HTH domain
MTRKSERTFSQVVRERRRQLDLTQQEVAQRIKTSTPYVGHLESGKRRPSDKILRRLAEVLGLDRRELFFLVNPGAIEMLTPKNDSAQTSVWEEFRRDEKLRRLHKITTEEMDLLSHVATLGEPGSPRDFIYILHAVRHALGR